MHSFYQSSHWFWVISRIVIVLMFTISMFQIMSDGGPRHQEEVLANGVSMLGAVLLAILAIIELARGSKPGWLRISAGVFLCLSGLGLLVLMLSGVVHGALNVLAMLAALWFLLAGVRDFVVR